MENRILKKRNRRMSRGVVDAELKHTYTKDVRLSLYRGFGCL